MPLGCWGGGRIGPGPTAQPRTCPPPRTVDSDAWARPGISPRFKFQLRRAECRSAPGPLRQPSPKASAAAPFPLPWPELAQPARSSPLGLCHLPATVPRRLPHLCQVVIRLVLVMAAAHGTVFNSSSFSGWCNAWPCQSQIIPKLIDSVILPDIPARRGNTQGRRH